MNPISMNGPAALANLRSEQFPILMMMTREDTGEAVHHQVISGPGAVKIPGFGDSGFKVTVHMYFGDGQAVRTDSTGHAMHAQLDETKMALVRDICEREST